MESLLSIDLEYDSKTKEIKAEKRNNGDIRIFRLHEKTCNSLIMIDVLVTVLVLQSGA